MFHFRHKSKVESKSYLSLNTVIMPFLEQEQEESTDLLTELHILGELLEKREQREKQRLDPKVRTPDFIVIVF